MQELQKLNEKYIQFKGDKNLKKSNMKFEKYLEEEENKKGEIVPKKEALPKKGKKSVAKKVQKKKTEKVERRLTRSQTKHKKVEQKVSPKKEEKKEKPKEMQEKVEKKVNEEKNEAVGKVGFKKENLNYFKFK